MPLHTPIINLTPSLLPDGTASTLRLPLRLAFLRHTNLPCAHHPHRHSLRTTSHNAQLPRRPTARSNGALYVENTLPETGRPVSATCRAISRCRLAARPLRGYCLRERSRRQLLQRCIR